MAFLDGRSIEARLSPLRSFISQMPLPIWAAMPIRNAIGQLAGTGDDAIGLNCDRR